MLMEQTGISAIQLRNFLTNYRKRHWKPVLNGRPPRSQLELVIYTVNAERIQAQVGVEAEKSP